MLATETVKDILGDHLTDEMKEIFPMDFKIAFWHPIRKNILIFISADMPHLVKKIVNAFESSGVKSSRDLSYKSKKMSLKKLEKIWKCDNGRLGDLRTNILTTDHFNKNPYSCMRVHLAIQVVS